MSKNPKTAIIIPTYNEKDNVKLLIAEIFNILPKTSIFIVDDNSPDGTASVVHNLKTTFPNLRLVSNSKKSGRGAAVIQGFKAALKNHQYDIFVEMDADFSHRPTELPELIRNVKTNTFVVSSRYLEGGQTINWPFHRRLFSHLANGFLKIILGIKLTDYTNGFRAYSKKAIKILSSTKLITNSYFTLTETALILDRSGFKSVEVPGIFPNRVRGKSNTNIREVKNNIIDLIKIKRTYQ